MPVYIVSDSVSLCQEGSCKLLQVDSLQCIISQERLVLGHFWFISPGRQHPNSSSGMFHVCPKQMGILFLCPDLLSIVPDVGHSRLSGCVRRSRAHQD